MIVVTKDKPKGIIWIVSYPRSGNTWTRAFLHSLFAVMRDPAAEGIDINQIEEGGLVENAASLYPRFLGKPVFLAATAEIAAARPWVQAALVESAGRPIYVKTHNARLMDHGSPLINMGVSLGAVYLVRNPLDVAISYAHLTDTTIDETIERMATSGWGRARSNEGGVERVRVIIGSWSENVASWTSPPHQAVLAVRYEDMLENPEAAFTRIVRHLRLKPSKAQLRKAMEMSGFERLRAQEATTGFTEKPERSLDPFFRTGRSGQWRERLSEAQVARIVEAHGPMMKRFGYLPD